MVEAKDSWHSLSVHEHEIHFRGEVPGFYEFRAWANEKEESRDVHSFWLAGNLHSEKESHISSSVSSDALGSAVPQTERQVVSVRDNKTSFFQKRILSYLGLKNEVWASLLVLVLLIGCAEWFTFHRRITV